MQHFRDDLAARYPGLGKYLNNRSLFWTLEYKAYMQEIKFARSQHDFESARKIIQLMRNRKIYLIEL
jgi:hypothetical protein